MPTIHTPNPPVIGDSSPMYMPATILRDWLLLCNHSVWKSPKKSHSTLRVKRALQFEWTNKIWLKMPKMVHFGDFWKTWSLRSSSVTRKVPFNWTKFKNSKATFWVIFKHCAIAIFWLVLHHHDARGIQNSRRCHNRSNCSSNSKTLIWDHVQGSNEARGSLFYSRIAILGNSEKGRRKRCHQWW